MASPNPIIDVHTHVFNAWDIPLKGYLDSRKNYDLLEWAKLAVAEPLILRCLRHGRPPAPSANPGELKGWAGWALKRLAPRGYMRWAHVLAMHVSDVSRQMANTYPSTDLFVPLMVDYEYWFSNTKDVCIGAQVKTIHEQVIVPFQGRIHPFVTFCPARQLAFERQLPNPDGNIESIDSLEMVKDAVLHKGFIGVKLYNAMGYRPLGNAAVERERRKIALHGSRYACFSGDDYDRVLTQLYEFCVEHEVPITAHCQFLPSIEAYKGASKVFGKADLWWPVLDKYPDLRLNLGHFGWYRKPGEGYHGKNGWTKDICVHMGRYPHLYADTGDHEVGDPDAKERFIDDYRDLMRDHPYVRQRLLYGTDWHVFIRQEKFEHMHTEYADVLRQAAGFIEVEIGDFHGGNAMRFLGLHPGGRNRERLREFYQGKNIPPPDWFQKTEAPA